MDDLVRILEKRSHGKSKVSGIQQLDNGENKRWNPGSGSIKLDPLGP